MIVVEGFRGECMGVAVHRVAVDYCNFGSELDKTAMEVCDWSVLLLPRKFARGSTLYIS